MFLLLAKLKFYKLEKVILEVVSCQKWGKKRGKNRQIPVLGFHFVARNIEG